MAYRWTWGIAGRIVPAVPLFWRRLRFEEPVSGVCLRASRSRRLQFCAVGRTPQGSRSKLRQACACLTSHGCDGNVITKGDRRIFLETALRRLDVALMLEGAFS